MFKSHFKTFRYKPLLTLFLILSYVVGYIAISLAISHYYVANDDYKSWYYGEPENMYFIDYFSNDFHQEDLVEELLFEHANDVEISYSAISREFAKDSYYNIYFYGYSELPPFMGPIVSGRHFSTSESLGTKPLAVVGKDVAPGQTEIILNDVVFEIVGVMGLSHRESHWDNMVYLPLGLMNKVSLVDKDAYMGRVRLHGEHDLVRKSALELKNSLNTIYANNELYQEDFKNKLNLYQVNLYLKAAGLILLITCVNVINLTSFWINNRKKEIGIRRAIGASDISIIKLVFSDLLILALLASAFALFLQHLFYLFIDTQLPLQITVLHVCAALLLPFICGLLTATIPIHKALSFPPKEAISEQFTVRENRNKFSLLNKVHNREPEKKKILSQVLNYSFFSLKILRKNKLSKIIIIFQLCISLFMFLSMAIIVEDLLKEYFESKVFLGSNAIVRGLSLNNEADPSGPEPNYDELRFWLSNHPSIDTYGTYFKDTTTGISELEGFEHLRLNDISEGRVEIRYLDESFVNLDLLRVIRGRELTGADFNNNVDHIPIIVGHHIGEKFEIGTILREPFFNRTYEIVGILEQGQKFLFLSNTHQGETSYYKMVDDADSFFFAPLSYTIKDDPYMRHNYYFYLTHHESIESQLIVQELRDFVNNTIPYTPLKTAYMNEIVLSVREIKIDIIFILLFSLTLIGLMGTMLETVIMRKNEFGVMIALGATPRRLAVDFYKEFLALFMISSSIIAVIHLYSFINKNSIIGPYTLLSIAAITVFFSLVITIYPIVKINRLNAVDLLNKHRS